LFSEFTHTANAPVIAPVTTDTKPACGAVGSGKVMNHSTTRQLMIVITSIIALGKIFHSNIFVADISSIAL
jgi:hypothetical protein